MTEASPAVAHSGRGGFRLAAALCGTALGYHVIFVAGADALVALLRRIEYLSNMPGLSGFVLLLISPGLFLAFCFVVGWVAEGFQKQPPGPHAPSAGT